ncbi:hypothetical protein BIW11_05915 [Tropilaelaps mercedesae]|uniref:Uncharacterized protein n=1 Tax=Tropilaelaps mercedesae TaxID=418985 RepID=A0A1V9Y0C4_9ACAR|nr:hypothetical protein BIW11_05915 [Tropilaelaps mercedesae]
MLKHRQKEGRRPVKGSKHGELSRPVMPATEDIDKFPQPISLFMEFIEAVFRKMSFNVLILCSCALFGSGELDHSC